METFAFLKRPIIGISIPDVFVCIRGRIAISIVFCGDFSAVSIAVFTPVWVGGLQSRSDTEEFFTLSSHG